MIYLLKLKIYAIIFEQLQATIKIICRSGEMADASDSKSDVGDNVWVRVPPSAPKLLTLF